jgi:hypothetical protein
MLRVCYSETPEGHCWRLSGRLAGPWVDDLGTAWRQARERVPRARAVVDLRDVTFIDEAGESLLAEMQTAGTELVAAGVDHKHLIATLRSEAGRPLRRTLDDCWGRCGDHKKPNGGGK